MLWSKFLFFRNLFWKVILGKHCKIFNTQKSYPVLFAIWLFKLWTMADANQKKLHIIICQFYEMLKKKTYRYTVCNEVTLSSFWVIRHMFCNKSSLSGDLMLCCCFLLYSLIICNLTLSHTFNWDTLIRES